MILDICILIDISRNNPDALKFLDGLSKAPSISVMTATEILCGVRNKREEALFENMFATWNVINVDMKISRTAAEFLEQFRASHGTDIIDATIAATAKVYNLQPITSNIKHFPMFDGITRPY